MTPKVKVYADGASRGNPGPSAIAFLLLVDGKVVKRHAQYIGIKTNNQAEYAAAIASIEFASTLTDHEVTCCMDSELVVKQLTGEYKVRNPILKSLWLKAKTLQQRFQTVSFLHVPRTDAYLQAVDRLANQILNRL